MRSNASRIAIDVVLSPHNLRVFVEIGMLVPLHVGAAGKILLAWLPDIEQSELIMASAAHYDDHPVGDIQALKLELTRIREAGWATSEGEREMGLSAIAAPIFNVNKEVVAAIALVAPTVRIGAEEQEKYVPLVCEAARRTSFDMGYTVDGVPLR